MTITLPASMPFQTNKQHVGKALANKHVRTCQWLYPFGGPVERVAPDPRPASDSRPLPVGRGTPGRRAGGRREDIIRTHRRFWGPFWLKRTPLVCCPSIEVIASNAELPAAPIQIADSARRLKGLRESARVIVCKWLTIRRGHPFIGTHSYGDGCPQSPVWSDGNGFFLQLATLQLWRG